MYLPLEESPSADEGQAAHAQGPKQDPWKDKAELRQHQLLELFWKEASVLRAEGMLALSAATFGRWAPEYVWPDQQAAAMCIKALRATCTAIRSQTTWA